MKVRVSKFVLAASVFFIGGSSAMAQDLTTDEQKMGYSIGFQFGQFLKDNTGSYDMEALLRGINDVVEENDLAMSDSDMQSAFTQFQQIAHANAQKVAAEAAKGNIAAGEAFLEENAKRDGVKVLPSGLQYEVIETGAGDSPEATDTVVTQYRGTFLDGSEFDSSYSRGEPSEFPVNRVIAGWTEALQLMRPGAKWKLYIPQDLAYGPQGNQGIPGGSALIFDIELLSIK